MLVSRDYVPANNTGSTAIVVVSWIFPVLATFAVAARFGSRKLTKSVYGADDWFILAALLPVWGHTAIILASSIVLGYQVCWMLMTILIGACMCRPFAKNWNPMLKGHCGDRIPAYIAIAALDIVGDFSIMCLPLPMIWKLHTSTTNKIGLSFVFALGTLDIIVAILRIIYLVQLNTTKDYTWDAVDCWIWSVLEPSLAAMVACGPTLGPTISSCLGRVRSSIKSSKATATTSSSSQYLSYPKNPRQFSNISDSEYPLQNVYGNHTTAASKAGGGEQAPTLIDEEVDEREMSLGVEDTEALRGSPGIRVQKDVQIRRSPSHPVVAES
ncbi:uncharacterized protein KY384_000140 [Bacidia gigantensis]|uniref:uncharacterized protein n=1 Tax=Bacidia gigantensis TaxID=2732470 RepID=UPI001D03A654|nr:uncharacterized protein KY384_000140 [Bacidia gigantensis]KAG8526147.1 hypothetical protein KY384_000140 [Bacidia gigantensis]